MAAEGTDKETEEPPRAPGAAPSLTNLEAPPPMPPKPPPTEPWWSLNRLNNFQFAAVLVLAPVLMFGFQKSTP